MVGRKARSRICDRIRCFTTSPLVRAPHASAYATESTTIRLLRVTNHVVSPKRLTSMPKKRSLKGLPPNIQYWGVYETTTATGTKTSLQNITLIYFKHFMIIPSWLDNTIWAKCPKTGLVRTHLK